MASSYADSSAVWPISAAMLETVRSDSTTTEDTSESRVSKLKVDEPQGGMSMVNSLLG